MQLNGLVNLYRSMKNQAIERYRFEYRHGHALFDVFFFIDESPFILLFGAKGEAFSFEMEVKAGFNIDPTLDSDTYKQLCRILGLKYDPNNPFSPKEFFTQFNQNVPHGASINAKAESHEIAQYRKIAEEEDKIYFLGWRNNELRGDIVSETNLAKTKDLLGHKAYTRCKSKNISSCWTDDPAKAKKVQLP